MAPFSSETFTEMENVDMWTELVHLFRCSKEIRSHTEHAKICGVSHIITEQQTGIPILVMCTRVPEHALVLGKPRHSWED